MDTQTNQKIKFNKIIENPEEIKKFSEASEFKKMSYPEYCISYWPEPLSIAKDYCTRLETRLKEAGYKAKNIDVGRLWISEPLQFSLSLNAATDNCLPIQRQIGVRTEKKLFKKEETPIVELFYRAHINGEVYYQDAAKNNLNQMIEILSAEGYKSEVLTTPKLIEEITETLEDSPKRSSYSDSQEKAEEYHWHHKSQQESARYWNRDTCL